MAQNKATSENAERKAGRMARLLGLGDMLTDRLELAISQLDKQMVKEKQKTRTVEYGEPDVKGKPTLETFCERETMDVTGGMPIDCHGLNQLTGVLKNLYAVTRAENGAGDAGGIAVGFGEDAREAAE
jgi:hypothetical protein